MESRAEQKQFHPRRTMNEMKIGKKGMSEEREERDFVFL